MKTIYAIDYLEDKFITVEIPVITEDGFYYYLDYEKLTYEQKYATDWNIALDKDKDGTTNWTTDKEQFEDIKKHFASKTIKQIQRQITMENERLNKTLESAYLIGALED